MAMITIRTAKQQRIIDLQRSRYRTPLNKYEAEALADTESFEYTHVATCEGIKPIYATVKDGLMTVKQSNGGDDYWEESVEVVSERDAISKLMNISSNTVKSILKQL